MYGRAERATLSPVWARRMIPDPHGGLGRLIFSTEPYSGAAEALYG